MAIRLLVLSLITITAAAPLGSVTVSRDAVPQRMNIQGMVSDAAGNPVNGPRSFEFRILRDGNIRWQEAQTCTLRAGLFAATLGATAPLPDSLFAPGTAPELELVIAGEVLSPRVALNSVGYSFRSLRSDTAATVARPIAPGVSVAEILDGAVTMPKLNGSGASYGDVIKWNGSNWQPQRDSAGGPPGGTAGGDLTGTYPNPTVAKLRGRTVSTTTPYTGDILAYSSSQWTPLAPGGDIDGEIDDIAVVGLRGRTLSTTTPYTDDILTYQSSQWTPEALDGDIEGAVNDVTVVGLQGRAVATDYPSSNEVLTWSSSAWRPMPLPAPKTTEELGSVRLSGGAAEVRLPDGFLAGTDGRFFVFVEQTSGDPVDVVVEKDVDRFTLRGPAGSTVSFDYRIVAQRKDAR